MCLAMHTYPLGEHLYKQPFCIKPLQVSIVMRFLPLGGECYHFGDCMLGTLTDLDQQMQLMPSLNPAICCFQLVTVDLNMWVIKEYFPSCMHS